MAEVSKALICEVATSIQTRMGNVEDGLREAEEDLHAERGHLLAMTHDLSNLYAGQAKIELRLGRIERGLELADAAA